MAQEPLAFEERINVGKAIYNLIKEDCPCKPQNASYRYEDVDSKKACLFFFTLSNSRYLSRNVLGGFTASLNFSVSYKNMLTGDSGKEEAQNLVNDITGWLNSLTEFPDIGSGRQITRIRVINPAYLGGKTEDGYSVFTADCTAEYEQN